MERVVSFLKASDARRPAPCAWLVSWSEEDILRQARESSERCVGRDEDQEVIVVWMQAEGFAAVALTDKISLYRLQVRQRDPQAT